MRILKVRDVEIGKGIPKIIAPICDKTEKEILHTAKKFSIIPVDFDILDIDIVEWRVDWYEYYNDYSKIEIVLEKLSKILKNIPIIFTIKRNTSDGEADITEEKYVEIYKEVCATKLVDFIDVEDSIGKDNMKEIIEVAKDMGTYVITTNHNLDHTPSKAECIATAKELEDMGADIIKIITKPSSKLDVVELLETTIIISEHISSVPICTI